jgi:hypothetical protein
LEGGADVHAADMSFQDGRTALHKACDAGNVKCVELLLDYEASADVKDVKGDTPLEVAIQSGHVMCVRALWDRTQEASRSAAALVELGVQYGQPEVVRCLLEMKCGVGTWEDYEFSKMKKRILTEERARSDRKDHERCMRQQADEWRAMEKERVSSKKNVVEMNRRCVSREEEEGAEKEEVGEDSLRQHLKVSILSVRRRRR